MQLKGKNPIRVLLLRNLLHLNSAYEYISVDVLETYLW